MCSAFDSACVLGDAANAAGAGIDLHRRRLGCLLDESESVEAEVGSVRPCELGQATVEAAFAIPVLMLLMLLLLQPGIILYDRIVMSHAAAEGCRLLATAANVDFDVCEDYIKRRLSAVPQVDQFHLHSSGCSYEIELAGVEESEVVSVRISTKLKPLPLLDAGMALVGMLDSSGALSVSVESSAQAQPTWVGSSSDGRDPGKWVMS